MIYLFVSSPNDNVDSPFTAAFWANFTSDMSGTIFEKIGEYTLARSSTWGFTLYLKGGGNFYYDSNPTITSGAWYHIAVAYDGLSNNDSVTFYLNGVAQTGTPGGNHDEMENTTGFFRAGYQIDMGMRDLALFDKELSQSEVTELASNATSSSFSDTGSIVSWWDFNKSLNDSVGSNDFSWNSTVGDFIPTEEKPFSITARINISEQVGGIGASPLVLLEKSDLANSQPGEYLVYIARDGADLKLIAALSEPTNTDFAVASFVLPSSKIYDWMNITITYDGQKSHTGLKLYVDSEEIAQDAANSETNAGYYGMFNTSQDLIISNAAKIRDVALFDKELSLAEAVEIFNEDDLSKFSGYSSIISWWKLKNNMMDSVSLNHGTFDNLSGLYTATEPVFSENSNLPRAFVSDAPVMFSGYGSDLNIIDGQAEYSDYQGAGYRFLRNVENSIVVNQRKNNILANLERIPSEGNNDVNNREFLEPAVQWTKPSTHYILDSIAHSAITSSQEIAEGEIDIRTNPLTYSYVNNIEFFSNPNLAQYLSVFDKNDSFQESLIELFKRTELFIFKIYC